MLYRHHYPDGVHHRLMDQLEDTTACDQKGVGVVFQLHITVVQITRINIHKTVYSFSCLAKQN